MSAAPTALELAPAGLAPGRDIWLKREDLHELGAFKWRGAVPTLEGYAAAGASAVVTASTGNHGAATAWAAQRAGLRALVYAPEQVSREKLALIERLGAEVRLVGADLDEAKEEGRAWALASGVPFFEDGAEPAQYEATARSRTRSSTRRRSSPPPSSCRSGTVRCSAGSDGGLRREARGRAGRRRCRGGARDG